MEISKQKFNPPSFGKQKENFVSIRRATRSRLDSVLMRISGNGMDGVSIIYKTRTFYSPVNSVTPNVW